MGHWRRIFVFSTREPVRLRVRVPGRVQVAGHATGFRCQVPRAAVAEGQRPARAHHGGLLRDSFQCVVAEGVRTPSPGLKLVNGSAHPEALKEE